MCNLNILLAIFTIVICENYSIKFQYSKHISLFARFIRYSIRHSTTFRSFNSILESNAKLQLFDRIFEFDSNSLTQTGRVQFSCDPSRGLSCSFVKLSCLSSAFINDTFFKETENIEYVTHSHQKLKPKRREVLILMRMKVQDYLFQRAKPVEYSKYRRSPRYTLWEALRVRVCHTFLRGLDD